MFEEIEKHLAYLVHETGVDIELDCNFECEPEKTERYGYVRYTSRFNLRIGSKKGISFGSIHHLFYITPEKIKELSNDSDDKTDAE